MPDVTAAEIEQALTCDGCLHAPATLLAAMGRTNADRTRAPGHALRLLCGDCADRTRVICERAGRAVTFLPLGLEPGAVTEWALAYTHRPSIGLAARRVVQPYPDEAQAREAVAGVLRLAPEDEPALMNRTISPWKEALDA